MIDFFNRLDNFLIYKGLNDNRLTVETGISNGLIGKARKRGSLSQENISKILYTYTELDANWLFTGIGSMIKHNTPTVNEPSEVYKLRTDKILESQAVPLYDIEAAAGIVTLFRDRAELTPIDYIQIPNLPKCDGAVYVSGDSMYPLLKSGDIVMYKEHDLIHGIIWGEMYLISYDHGGDDITSVKYIKKSELGDEFITLVSQNQHHQDRDINIQQVRALALIKASIRINSMS